MTYVESVAGVAAPRVRRPAVPLLVLAIDLSGVALGLLWWWLAPVAQVRVQSDGAYYVDPVPGEFITGDLWFALLSVVLGGALGLAAHRWVRPGSTVVVALLAGNGLLASLIGWRLGLWLGHVDLKALATAPAGTVSPVSLELTAVGFLVLLPVTALAGWLAADLWADFRRRGEPADPVGPVSPTDLPAPPGPPSA